MKEHKLVRSTMWRSVFPRLAGLTAGSVAAGILLAGVGMPLVGLGAVTARGGVAAFQALPADLGDTTLSQSTTIQYADGSVLARVYDVDRVVVAQRDIAPLMQQAVIAIEDARFYQHGPVDVRGITRAVVHNAGSGGRSQGASTLTQQYVKNLLIDRAVQRGDAEAAEQAVTARGAAGYGRKLRELRLAIVAEEEMTKDEVLTGYLNAAYFANGAYGVEAATQRYFSKSARDLTLPEAALLAGMVQNPADYDPLQHEQRARDRRNVVLGRMLELGMISPDDHAAAVAAPLGLRAQPRRQGCATAGSAAYFCDYVIRLVQDQFSTPSDPALGESMLRRGGLTIRTTLDPVVQSIAQEAVDAGVRPGQAARAATSVVQPGTGHVVAMVQNTRFSTDGEPGSTTLNYNVARDVGGTGGFQQGSTFKPFTLATWLTSGRSLDDVVPAPATGSDLISSFTACGSRIRSSETFRYTNSEGSGPGSMTVADATAQSVNTAYVAMEKQLDICDIAETAESMGVHKATPSRNFLTGNVSRALDQNPSMTLGTNSVTPLSVAAAYAGFAADGVFCEPVAITGILDAHGEELSLPPAQCRQALRPAVARGVTAALQRGWSAGTARNVPRIGRPVASKTGTTNDSTDTWLAAYTPQLAAAVWVGHEATVTSLNRERINGRRYGTVLGATIAGPIWARTIGGASTALDLPVQNFPAR